MFTFWASFMLWIVFLNPVSASWQSCSVDLFASAIIAEISEQVFESRCVCVCVCVCVTCKLDANNSTEHTYILMGKKCTMEQREIPMKNKQNSDNISWSFVHSKGTVLEFSFIP